MKNLLKRLFQPKIDLVSWLFTLDECYREVKLDNDHLQERLNNLENQYYHDSKFYQDQIRQFRVLLKALQDSHHQDEIERAQDLDAQIPF